MTNSSSKLCSVKERDYLTEDDPVRGQNYCCTSFITPMDVIQQKALFTQSKFLSSVSREIANVCDMLKQLYPEDRQKIEGIQEVHKYIFDNPKELQEQYLFFLSSNKNELDNEFDEKHDFQTSVIGVKVRGSYETRLEAEHRAKTLQEKDPTHNIFVSQVGCWLPMDVAADDIANQQYAEDELNTLMKTYNEQDSAKQEHYEERRKALVEEANRANAAAAAAAKKDGENDDNDEGVTDGMEEAKDNDNEGVKDGMEGAKDNDNEGVEDGMEKAKASSSAEDV